MTTMQPSTPSSAPVIQRCWRLLAISLDPDRESAELYGAIHESEKDVPLMADGRLVLFTDPARAPEWIRRYGGLLASDPMEVDEPTRWCDVAQALHHLSAGGNDQSASVVDAVNVLLDLVTALGTKISEDRRRALESIANYCTTSKDVTRYLEEVGEFSSRALVDAVLWCVGAVAVKARIVDGGAAASEQ